MASDRERRARSRSAQPPPSSASDPVAVFTPRRRQSSRPGSGGGMGGGRREREGPAPPSGPSARLVTPPREPLEPRTRKFLVRLANDTSNHLIRDSLEQDEPGSVLWKPFAVLRGVDVLRGVEREHAEASDAACLRGSTDVSASIEEFALLFKLDSSGLGASSAAGAAAAPAAANGHGLLFDADLQDMVTLYPIVLPSGEHPRRFVGIKWCLVGAPSRLFRRRDFCFLECQKEFTDGRGRRGWVRSMHSVKLPTVPSLEQQHGIVRASLYRSGLTVVETSRPGVLRVTYTVEMDLKGRLPERLLPKLIAQRISRLADIDRFLQTQRLSSSPLLGDLDLADGLLPDDADADAVALAGPRRHRRAACQLCYRPFGGGGLLPGRRSKRFACRKCGESVCKNCSDDWLLDVPVIGQTMVRICTVCSAEAKHSHTVAAAVVGAGADARQTHAQGDERPSRDRRAVRDHSHNYNHDRDRDRERDRDHDRDLHQQQIHQQIHQQQERASGRQRQVDDGRRGPRMRRRSVSMDNSSFDPMVDERTLFADERSTFHAPPSRMMVAAAAAPPPPELRFDRAQIGRVQWHGPAQRQTLVDDDDGDDDDDSSSSMDDDRPTTGESLDRPSFMSSERDPSSVSAEPEFFGAIAGPDGASEASDDQEEELTIDGAGEIRATADLTRWWTDERAQRPATKPRPLSGGGMVHDHRLPTVGAAGDALARRQERATWHNNAQALAAAAAVAPPVAVAGRSQTVLNAQRARRPQSARAVLTPARRDAAEQERMDLLSHFQRQSAAASTSAGLGHAYQQFPRQAVGQGVGDPFGAAERARDEEPEDEEEDEEEVTVPPPPQHRERMSQLQRIREHQHRQQEMLRQRQLAYQQQQQQQQQQQPSPTRAERQAQDASEREREPLVAPVTSMAAALAASTSSAATSSSMGSMGSESSGQSSGVDRFFAPPPSSVIAGTPDDAHFASSSSTNSSDQTAGEASEYVETASGQWVTRGNPPAVLAPRPSAVKAASARRQAAGREEPGFCVHCGAPEFLGDRGNVLRGCDCASAASDKQSARTIQLRGRVVAGDAGSRVQVAVDVDEVIPLIVERLSQQALHPPAAS